MKLNDIIKPLIFIFKTISNVLKKIDNPGTSVTELEKDLYIKNEIQKAINEIRSTNIKSKIVHIPSKNFDIEVSVD